MAIAQCLAVMVAAACLAGAAVGRGLVGTGKGEQAVGVYESLLHTAAGDVGAGFQAFVALHGKQYTAGEALHRLGVFAANVERVVEHNSRGGSYQQGLNPYADLTTEEFRALFFGSNPKDLLELPEEDVSKSHGHFPYASETPPKAVDWRSKGMIGPIKNQHVNGSACGCCYAFGAIAGVEAANAIYTGKVETLSEQQIVDCDQNDYGCDGGDFRAVVKYVRDNGGIDSDADYPYKAEELKCARKKEREHAVTVDGYISVPRNNETALMQALAHTPTIVAVCCGAFLDQWHLYKSGIFDLEAHCDKPLDHSVLVVGYGTEAGGDFWEIKNSWGAEWGMAGFMRLKRSVDDKHGQNGLATMPAYVVKTHPNPSARLGQLDGHELPLLEHAGQDTAAAAAASASA